MIGYFSVYPGDGSFIVTVSLTKHIILKDYIVLTNS